VAFFSHVDVDVSMNRVRSLSLYPVYPIMPKKHAFRFIPLQSLAELIQQKALKNVEIEVFQGK